MSDPKTAHREKARTAGAFALLCALGGCLVFLIIVIVLGVKLHQRSVQLAATQTQLNQAKSDLASAKEDLSKAKSQVGDLQPQLDQAKAQAAELKTQLDQSKAATADVQSQLDKSKAQTADLQTQLGQSKAQSADLQTQLTQAKDGSTQLLTQLDQAQIQTMDLHLKDCHRWRTDREGLQSSERYFGISLTYQDFNVSIAHVAFEGADILSAGVQFKRPSTRWQPLFNTNRFLVRRLRMLLTKCYGGDRGIESKYDFGGERMGSRVHFGNDPSRKHNWRPDSSFEEWGSEAAIFDEPYSSGSTAHTLTNIRNDFVILRFARYV